MKNSVEIVESDDRYELQNKINRLINGRTVKDIKFCVNPDIHAGFSASYSSGANYYAMIIFEI